MQTLESSHLPEASVMNITDYKITSPTGSFNYSHSLAGIIPGSGLVQFYSLNNISIPVVCATV